MSYLEEGKRSFCPKVLLIGEKLKRKIEEKKIRALNLTGIAILSKFNE